MCVTWVCGFNMQWEDGVADAMQICNRGVTSSRCGTTSSHRMFQPGEQAMHLYSLHRNCLIHWKNACISEQKFYLKEMLFFKKTGKIKTCLTSLKITREKLFTADFVSSQKLWNSLWMWDYRLWQRAMMSISIKCWSSYYSFCHCHRLVPQL